MIGAHDDPAVFAFWETVQDLDLPIAFHVVARSSSVLQGVLGGGEPVGSRPALSGGSEP